MMKRGWSSKVIIRYVFIQLPGLLFLICILLLLHGWLEFPVWVFWIIVLASTGIDVLLFFYTWPSYDWNQKDTMTGETGIVLVRLDPTGYIRIHGEQWKGELIEGLSPVEKGQKVEVCGREGLILQVRPEK